MVDVTNNAPLPADPRRQAHDTIAAFAFQLWHSVDAWLDLREDESLFLEGAEDIDLVGPRQTATTQVKNSLRHVTLRSSEILEAISHFWQLRNSAPTQLLQFRFLSRGKPGVESGNPFGRGVAGLTLWENVSATDDEVRKLAWFLAKMHALPRDMREFLRKSPDSEIFTKLLQPMRWLWEQAGAEFVEEGVRGKLVLLGEKFGVPPDDAAAIRHQLYSLVTKTAGNRRAGPLTRLALLELFSGQTQVTVPRAELNDLRRFTQQILKGAVHSVPPTAGLNFDVSEGNFGSVPPLPEPILRRQDVTDEFRSHLDSHRCIFIYGSTGMGKSTLAKLLAGESQATWFDCSGKDADDLRRGTQSQVVAIPNGSTVVFDDIGFYGEDARQIENWLGAQILQLKQRGCRIILTSKDRPTNRFYEGLAVPAEAGRTVPRLDRDEIEEMLRLVGYFDTENLRSYSSACLVATSGHPQLLRALIIELRTLGWPDIAAIHNDSSAIAGEKMDARKLLLKIAADARDLIYRLSLIGSSFRRDQALAIASIDPAIAMPGEHLDGLIGPWLEPLQAGYFRLSPLLADVGTAIYPADTIRNLRVKSIDAVMKCDPRTANEASFALRTAFVTGSEEHLVAFMANFNEAPTDVRRYLAKELTWFLLIKMAHGTVLFPGNQCLSRFLRNLQFKIAALAVPKLVNEIAAKWHAEVHELDSDAKGPEKVMLASSVLSNYDVSLDSEQVLSYLSDIVTAEKEFPEMFSAETLEFSTTLTDQKNLAFIQCVLSVVRCKDVGYLETLLGGLENSSDEFRNTILTAWKSAPFVARQLIVSPFLWEDKKKSPQWERVLRVYEKAFEVGRIWNWPLFRIHAIRGIALVLDEKLSRSTEALQQIDQHSAEANLSSALLDDARAAIHFNQGRNAEALVLWNRALADWPEPDLEGEISQTWASRAAAIAAGRLGRWTEAAELFQSARRFVDPNDRPELAAGLDADAALCWWEASERSLCLLRLKEALQTAAQLPPGTDNLLAFRVRKLVGHAIMWLHNEVQGRSRELMNRLLPGACSEQFAPEALKSLPECDVQVLWLFLARFAVSLNLPADFYDAYAPHTDAITSWHYPSFREEFRIQVALRNVEIERLPDLAWALARCFENVCKDDPEVPPAWPKGDGLPADAFRLGDIATGPGIFIAGLICGAAANHDTNRYLSEWANMAKERPNFAAYNEWLDSAKDILNGPLEDSVRTIYKATAQWWRLLLHSLRISLDPEATPKNLVHAHCCLLIQMCGGLWIEPCGPALSGIFETAWRRQTLLIALLNTPRLTIPNIVSSCDLKQPGVNKAVSIVLSALPAVSVRVDEKTMEALKEIKDGDYSSKL